MNVEEIYKTPKAESLPLTPIEQLLAKQSIFGVVIGTFSAGIPSMLLYIMLFNSSAFQIFNSDYTVLLLMPILGFIIGMTAQVCGGGIERRLQLCCGTVTLFLILIANYFVASSIGLFSSLFTVIIATYFSKIRLTEQEKVALSQWQAQNGQ